MLVFVDDRKHYVNSVLKKIKEFITIAMEKSIWIWDELLYFIGEKLELSKYEFYIVKWKFDKNEKPIVRDSK